MRSPQPGLTSFAPPALDRCQFEFSPSQPLFKYNRSVDEGGCATRFLFAGEGACDPRIRCYFYSSALLMPFFAASGFLLQHGELDFSLQVVDAVDHDAEAVADGVGFARARADDLAGVFVIGVVVVRQGGE